VADFGLIEPKVVNFKADDGTTLYGKLLLPANVAPDAEIPLIVNVYGGPAGQLVRNEWIGTTGLFHQLLARRGYAIFSVDNRGTPGRDRKFQTSIRRQFGGIELKDQLAALDQLLSQYPQLDRSRIAIWGWSGGGSSTLHAMFRFGDVFKVGVAVAPVPDQRLYDTIYQERYMGLPQDNAEGYRVGSPISYADGLRGKLLIIHGSGDDNVHYQGTERLVNRLVQLAKPFDLMVYPNRSHAISEGEGTTLHVHTKIAHYLLDGLGQSSVASR
jgi:dipeptidyl-peptidase-4